MKTTGKVSATKKVGTPLEGDDKAGIQPAGPNVEGQTEAVNDAMAVIGELTWEERKHFMKRFAEVFGEEANLRSAGHDFDTAAYA